uniref:Vacuolar amino acid transporter 1 isoform X2 n=1 Tax=Nicotiana tabacum TaxID=4097 RepID=A0A1S3YU50_TOBAC|nr:PREDICTED: vacuolar amino acid transporter 1-like isoform X2 [Nicotiana tabacum]
MEPKSEDDYSNIRVRLLVANDNYYKQNKGSSEETRLEDPQLQHEFVSGPTSFSRTCFNGLNALSGVGILSVPSALASGGWLSLIFLFIIAISTYYTSLLIQRCMDIDPTITSYPDIGKRAFGKCGRMLVSTTIGVVASIVLLGSIFWAAMFDGLGFQANGTQFINWKGMPTAVSLYAFCYCAHPVFPTLYTSMINPKKFSKVMLVCFLLCTISYASMAIVGYLMFGPTVLSQITLNLPTNKISSKVAIYTTLVNPIAKYGLMIKPLVISFENQLPVNSNKRVFSILIRTALVISTIIVALAIPFFGYLMSLVGAFLSITASIILPCLCFLRISGIYRTLGFELVVIVGIVIMGIAIMIVGTYTSVVEIIGHL